MRILAYNPGHDGAAVLLENDRLSYSIENEKDNGPRRSPISTDLWLRSLAFEEPPEIVAVSGWYKASYAEYTAGAPVQSHDLMGAGYWDVGSDAMGDSEILFAGRKIRRFESSHARSHIMCSYGLSPFPQGQPCYALVWEGDIGAMYYVDENVSIRKLGDVVFAPGHKYVALYRLASAGPTSAEEAGKVMALAACGQRREPTRVEQDLVDTIMSLDRSELWSFLFARAKSKLEDSPYYGIGLETAESKDLMWQFSTALFNRFYNFAKENVTPGLPLLISGGCGLNCDWNTQWRECGLFSDVFVPPCPNDSGVALGAAIDALHHYTGRAKITWNVYAGDSFVENIDTPANFECYPLSLMQVSKHLLAGDVIAWVQGRCEMGPRALGNRSLLAEPFWSSTRDKLNRIKQREAYRPIAPICLEEDFNRHFDSHGPSPHMLYFQRVRSKQLAAITHEDGSARGQSVNDAENQAICALLREFREHSGVAVLCNTSLNFKGRGFINRLSDLFVLAQERGIDGIVVGTRYWRLRREQALRP